MNEGAVTLTREGLILFANRCFADMIKMPLEAIIGFSIYNFINPEAGDSFDALMIQSEIKLNRSILEQASEAIAVCDEGGRVIRVNQMATALCCINPLGLYF